MKGNLDKYKQNIIMEGNFWFIKPILPNIYNIIFEGESLSRTNLEQSARCLGRIVLEKIIDYILEVNNLKNNIPAKTLDEKIKLLNNEDELRKVCYLTSSQSLKDKPILPDLGLVRFKTEDGNINNRDYYNFLRRLGNAPSHTAKDDYSVVINYDHIIKALKGFYRFFQCYFSDLIPQDLPDFQEYLMPIDKFYIYDSQEPSDSMNSKCLRVFNGFQKDSIGNPYTYVVIRQYSKTYTEENFLLRNTDTFIEASKQSMSIIPDGMSRMEEITQYKNEASPFYIISYTFNRKPYKLSETLLKQIDLGKRLKMCKRIADCFYNLHNSEVPIYHRFLSYESFYICDSGKEWTPYVIKFDFAKIEWKDRGTVIAHAIDAKEKIPDMKQLKYLAPEWRVTGESDSYNWGKIDIYSLGILFSDILAGEIRSGAVSFDKLEELNLSDRLLDLLDDMRADSPDKRPDMEEIQEVLRVEVKKF